MNSGMTYYARWFFYSDFSARHRHFRGDNRTTRTARWKKSFFKHTVRYILCLLLFCRNKRAGCAWHILCFYFPTIRFKINYLLEFKLIQKHCDVFEQLDGCSGGSKLGLTNNNNNYCSRHARTCFCQNLKCKDIFAVFPWRTQVNFMLISDNVLRCGVTIIDVVQIFHSSNFR